MPKYIYNLKKKNNVVEEKDLSGIKNIMMWIGGLIIAGTVLSLSFLRYRLTLSIEGYDGWVFVLVDGLLFRVTSLVGLIISWLAISKRSITGLFISSLLLFGIVVNYYFWSLEISEQESNSFIIACPGWSRSGFTPLDGFVPLLVFSLALTHTYLLFKSLKSIFSHN